MNENENKNESIDWQSLLRRKDRPLPKAGCSWAFYLFLLLLMLFLVIMYFIYNNNQ